MRIVANFSFVSSGTRGSRQQGGLALGAGTSATPVIAQMRGRDQSCLCRPCRSKNKEAKDDPVADKGSKKAEPIKEGPFGLKSSKQGEEEGPVDDHQVKNPTKEAAGHVLGHESASKLDRALNTVENTLVSTSDCALKDMVGTYEFQDEEKGVFRYLVSVMRRLAVGNFALAATTVAVTASKVFALPCCVKPCCTNHAVCVQVTVAAHQSFLPTL